jgi:hypothetical protein
MESLRTSLQDEIFNMLKLSPSVSVEKEELRPAKANRNTQERNEIKGYLKILQTLRESLKIATKAEDDLRITSCVLTELFDWFADQSPPLSTATYLTQLERKIHEGKSVKVSPCEKHPKNPVILSDSVSEAGLISMQDPVLVEDLTLSAAKRRRVSVTDVDQSDPVMALSTFEKTSASIMSGSSEAMIKNPKTEQDDMVSTSSIYLHNFGFRDTFIENCTLRPPYAPPH